MADDSLETPLDPELLRAVPLQVCLQGIGKHWKRSLRRSTSDGDSSFGVNTYGMSRKTDRIDYFFSHDWETSRVLKWLSLLVMFNAPAAAMVMLSVTSLLSILAAVGSIPNMLWPLLPLLAAISYFVTLGFWQKLRSLWRKQPLVFLDRLCIAQHDVALKERGIRGLRCFLAKSQNLTILWSGRYFSRLWCLYELASYLKNERLQEKRHIQILPVHLCLLLLISCLQSTAWIVVILIFRSMDQRPNSSPVLHQLFGRGGAAFIPLSLYVGLGCMTRLYELPDQLRHFRVQDAQCFCCSNDHRHPETGKELPCDRKLVFSALEKWFGDGSSESESWIHHFNLMVRAKLSSRIAGTVGRGLPPFSYVLSTVCMSPLPFIAFFLPASLRKLAEDDDDGGKESDDDDGEGKWQGKLLELLVPPLYGVWCLLLIIQACRFVFYIFHGCGVSTLPLATSRWRRASLALLMSPIIWAILVFGIWVPLLGEYSDDLELPPMARFTLYLAYWALAAAIFLMPQINCGTQTPQGPESLESLSLEHSFGSVGRSSDPGDSRDPKLERVGVVKALADSGEDLPPWELMKTPPFRCEDKENAEDAEEEEMVSVRF